MKENNEKTAGATRPEEGLRRSTGQRTTSGTVRGQEARMVGG